MEEYERRDGEGYEEMGDEEDTIRIITDRTESRRVEQCHSEEGEQSKDDDAGHDPLLEDPGLDEEVKVEGGMAAEQRVYDTAQDPVETVDTLVGRAKDEGEGVQGLEGHEVLEGKLGHSHAAQPLGKMEIVCVRM